MIARIGGFRLRQLRNTTPRTLLFASIAMFLFALFFAYMGISSFGTYLSIASNKGVTTGTLIGCQSQWNRTSGWSASCILGYAVDNQIYTKNVTYDTNTVKDGQHVSVMYDHANPSIAETQSQYDPATAIVLWLFALGCMACSVYAFWCRHQQLIHPNSL